MRCIHVQAEKVPLPDARFRAAAAAIGDPEDEADVYVFGGHHRCQDNADFEDPDSDGGCDELASTLQFVGSVAPPVYIVTESA